MSDAAVLLESVTFNDTGLVCAIAQDVQDGRVLMQAWMNRETLKETLETGRMVYWSRSRKKRWAKGETSGHVQKVHEVRIDCDGDALLFFIEQTGAACHKGFRSCFYRRAGDSGWTQAEEQLVDM
ncbi:MAG: phosphoribosyl-AMP cyclohydrolase [Fibrobacterota bacterium]